MEIVEKVESLAVEAPGFYTPGNPRYTPMTDKERKCADRGNTDKSGGGKAQADPTTGIYKELRRLAGWHLRREGPGHTLQPTALANEAYLRLYKDRKADPGQRTKFMALASTQMRRVLLDHHNRKVAQKRFGAAQRVTLSDEVGLTSGQTADFEDLHEALEKLETLDVRRARVIEYRFFVGMSVAETAEALGVAERTVKKDWALARGWLRRELSRREEGRS
jgi:RNA polymerase sigma factor (TIGR02999 family)